MKQKLDFEQIGEVNMGDGLNGPYTGKEQLAQDLMDMEMGMKQRKPFTRDDFIQMINLTYSEFYGKFKDQFNPDEYLQCVDDEDFVKRYGAFLEQSEDNILTRNTVPWLDLGNIPSTHSFMRAESD